MQTLANIVLSKRNYAELVSILNRLINKFDYVELNDYTEFISIHAYIRGFPHESILEKSLAYKSCPIADIGYYISVLNGNIKKIEVIEDFIRATTYINFIENFYNISFEEAISE